jgi:CRISPR-associated protein Csm4
MPELELYHLTPKSAFHLGQRGVGQEESGVHLPSDTLFAALVTSHIEAGGKAAALAEPPFGLTSAFPRAGSVRFYPALPLSLVRLSPAKLENRLKELKAIQFVSEAIFKKMIAGELLDDWLPDEAEVAASAQGLYLQSRSLWLTAAEAAQLPEVMQVKAGKLQQYRALRQARVWQTVKIPRVTVDRQRNASAIFHTGRLSFSPGCGWWFGLAWPKADPDGQKVVERVLKLLADGGMGGERAAGYGHFSCDKVGPMRWPDPAPGQLFVTLSRYHPRPEELSGLRADPAAYKLVSVAGWLNSAEAHTRSQAKAQRRRRLWLLAEGSAVQAVGAGPWGDITDVRPDYPAAEFPHPVWRYGLACPVALTHIEA